MAINDEFQPSQEWLNQQVETLVPLITELVENAVTSLLRIESATTNEPVLSLIIEGDNEDPDHERFVLTSEGGLNWGDGDEGSWGDAGIYYDGSSNRIEVYAENPTRFSGGVLLDSSSSLIVTEQGAAPDPVANAVVLYAIDAAGLTQLNAIFPNGTIIELGIDVEP